MAIAAAAHDVTFVALYGLAAVAAYVVSERAIYLGGCLREARSLAEGKLSSRNRAAGDMLADYVSRLPDCKSRLESEDAAEAAYLRARERLQRRLWVVDTTVTAAPLLGLLGTILGIMDTFQALATSGISDPGAVSRGIGTALVATAVGIGIALVALVANNAFQRQVEVLCDLFRIVVLRQSQGVAPPAPRELP